MAAKIIENFIKMALFKKGGAIATDKAVQFSANALEKRLINLGIDPRTLNNQTELKQVLAYVKQMEDAAFDQKFSGIMKNQNLFKKEGDVIPFKQKRSFAEEIEAMKKSGDLVDKDNMVISEKITDREMFKNSNLNKSTAEETIMDRINKANNRITEIKKEQADMYKPKSDAEIKAKFDKQNQESIQRFKDKMKKDEPEDKADGGRIGFRAGKFVLDKIITKLLGDPKKIKQAADDIFPTGDYKYDAQMAAEALVENNPKIFKNKLYDDLDTRTQIEIYGAVLEPIQKNMAIARQLKKASRPEKTLESMKKGEGIDMSNPDIADEFTRFMKETDPQGSKTIEQTVELSNFDPKGRKKNATGGRAGFYTGGITDVEPSLDDIGHGADALMARTRLMAPNSQATTSTGLNYLLAEDNDNMRVPFKVGGDAGRRAFLKLMATIGGGVAAAKSGILGLGEGAGKKAVTETVKKSVGSGQPPPYFFKLVEKIRFMGDDTLASKDKAIAKKYKDYYMEEDFAGNIEIIKKGEDLAGNKLEDVYMKYTVDDVALKNKKGFAKVDEYEEFTARPDMEGKMKDVEQGVPNEVVEEAGDIDAMTLKKADGGRIGFSGGNLAKLLAGKKITSSSGRFLEKIFGKGSLNEISRRDPEMHRGLLEVVEMFRNRDNAGLIEYMQNFLPHMSKKEIQAFIKGDAVDAAGQGKYGLGDMQGQLIRLGSGRDYKGKLEAMKKLDNAQKLDTLDVTEEMIRKPNASGGIQTMLGE